MGVHAGARPTKNTRFSLQIGTFFQGGTYVGNITVSSVTYGIVLSPESSFGYNLQWKTTNTPTPGTQSLDDGWTNTNNMNDANHPAAQYVRSLTTNGYNDWYLPSHNEYEFLIKPLWDNSIPINYYEYGPGSAFWSSSESPFSSDFVTAPYTLSDRMFMTSYERTETFVVTRAVRRFVI
jgi:hypothetical protein